MKILTKKEQESFDRYQYLMRYGSRIENTIKDMQGRGISIEKINDFFVEQKESIKPGDLFDFIRGTRHLAGYVELNWSDKSQKQFIIDHRSDFSVVDLYNKIFQTLDPIINKEAEGWTWLNRINASNIETALRILFILENQEPVEQKILEKFRSEGINQSVLYRIVWAYLLAYEAHDIIVANCNFLHELIKKLVASFPTTPYKDDKDRLLALFRYACEKSSPGITKKIVAFLKENSISPIAWVRAAYAGLIDIPDDTMAEKMKQIDLFIEEHIKEFSYDELLERVINCRISETAISLELRVMDKIKGETQVDNDITKKYKEGKVSEESWDYLFYIRPSLRSK